MSRVQTVLFSWLAVFFFISGETWAAVSRPLPVVRWAEANTLLKKKKWDEAAIVLRSIFKDHPEHPQVGAKLAQALAYNRRREEALQILHRLLDRVSPKAQKGIRERIGVLSRAFFSNDTFVRYQEGVNTLWEIQTRRAQQHFQAAIEQEPYNVEILTRLGQTFILSGDPESAAEYLLIAKRLNPFLPEIQLWLGRALFQKGEVQEALTEMTAAYAHLKNSELAPIWIAEAYVESGHRELALDFLNRDTQNHSSHLLSFLKAVEIYRVPKVFGRPIPKTDLLTMQSHLKTILVFLPEYEKSIGIDEGNLGFRPITIQEVKIKAEKLSAEVDARLDRLQ